MLGQLAGVEAGGLELRAHGAVEDQGVVAGQDAGEARVGDAGLARRKVALGRMDGDGAGGISHGRSSRTS